MKKFLSILMSVIMILSVLSALSVSSFAASGENAVELLQQKVWVDCGGNYKPETGEDVDIEVVNSDRYYFETVEYPNLPKTVAHFPYKTAADYSWQREDDGNLSVTIGGSEGGLTCVYTKIDDTMLFEAGISNNELVSARVLVDVDTYIKAVNCNTAYNNAAWQSEYLNEHGVDAVLTDDSHENAMTLYKNGEKIAFDSVFGKIILMEIHPLDMNTICAVYMEEDGNIIVDNWTRIGPAVVAFPDVKQGEWYYENVISSVKSGYFHGYQDGTFGPGNSIIRQDFAVVLANAAHADLDSADINVLDKFSDVDKNAYYAKALAWCVENGIISGYENGRFGPADPVTREQICVMLSLYITDSVDNAFLVRKAEDMNEIISQFPDSQNISSWARLGVASCLRGGLISGADGGRIIDPTATANRAQIATIFMNMSKNGII